jgi:hypothetical protein
MRLRVRRKESEAKEEVQRTFEACDFSQGGIIACGKAGPDVPLENIRAMYEAFREYRIPQARLSRRHPRRNCGILVGSL